MIDCSSAKVLTVSDGVADGSRDDKSGRALAERLRSEGYDVVEHRVVADGVRTSPTRCSR